MKWPSTEKIVAPWSAQQVDVLNRSQRDGSFHGYTCGNDHDGDRHLIATDAGWFCPSCDYTQDWFHAGVIGRIAFLAPNTNEGTNL